MIKHFSHFKPKVSSLIFKELALFVLLPGLASAQVFGAPQNATVPATNVQTGTPSAEQATPTASQGTRATGGLNNVQIKRVSSTNVLQEQKDDKDAIVLLYMRDFKISKTLSGFVNCTMKFYVYSTLPTRISNLSYRLKWTDMETPLSFDNVEPNGAVYQEYSLLGNGCYNMDQTPNIIVNRCRVKDMTQQACASKIHWAK